jgi:flagellum-specific peptidoglycan hydrolase FlgJ
MKKILISFLCGALLGAAVIIALEAVTPQENSSARQVLDWLIGEWTSQQFLSVAGFPGRVELPDAKPGYFPDTVRALALHIEQAYHIPKGVTLAQWALESSWGRNNLGVSNYFGHTFAAVRQYLSDTIPLLARELIVVDSLVPGKVVRFARYKNIAECFEVHGKYVSRSTLFARAFAQHSADKFAFRLATHYATDPEYGRKLVTIMKRYNL